jgi:hypothetical protein
MLLSVCLHSMSSLREAFFREVVVGGLGGSTLNPADIVGKGGEERRAYSYTSVAQDIGKNTTRSTLRRYRTEPRKKGSVVDQCQLQEPHTVMLAQRGQSRKSE